MCQEDLLELYAKAITCAVLAKAGPQRKRVLASLQKVTSGSCVALYDAMFLRANRICNVFCGSAFCLTALQSHRTSD